MKSLSAILAFSLATLPLAVFDVAPVSAGLTHNAHVLSHHPVEGLMLDTASTTNVTPRPQPAVSSEMVDNHTGDYNNDLAADARSTNTLDWSCIRNAESHDNYHQVSGAYGVLTGSWQGLGMTGTPGQASVRVQDRFALRLFKLDGNHFGGSWHDDCTMEEGLD